MLIEFHSPQGKVHDWVTQFVKDKLLELHQRDKMISQAKVFFREQPGDPDGSMVCEIDLTIYGSSLFISRNAASYEQASREVIGELIKKAEDQIEENQSPPDEMTSTVRV